MGIVNVQQRMVVKRGIPSTLSDGTTIDSIVIDRLAYESCVVGLLWETPTGTPTAATELLKIQHGAAANLSDAADYVSLDTALDVSAAGDKTYYVDLSAAKRYIRLYLTGTLSSGSSPKIQIAACVALFDKETNAAGSGSVLGI